MKRSTWTAAGLIALATTAGLGCSNGTRHPSSTGQSSSNSSPGTPAGGQASGYTEVRRGNTILVASTAEGVERIRAGEEPAAKVAGIGFGPRGEKVVFEASKDGALEKALMAEFDRRHGQK